MDENSVRWKKREEVYIPPIPFQGFGQDIILREKVNVIPLVPKMKVVEPPEIEAPVSKGTGNEGAGIEEGDDLTVLLNPYVEEDGSDKTVLLQNNVMRIKAYLERERTGERIEIDKAVFVIGKERKKVDYQITGNPSVSRTHIKIEKRLDGYYVSDLDSSNHTYIDEQEIKTDFRLENGMKIMLADEWFIFSIVCER